AADAGPEAGVEPASVERPPDPGPVPRFTQTITLATPDSVRLVTLEPSTNLIVIPSGDWKNYQPDKKYSFLHTGGRTG
ncbi:MAG TPA: hypothetical protein VN203_07685, partial [Candidatus Acidoferrum sp.]|nr:hypothetical protein [Candidatus Acidoferrum sp.]